MRLFTVRTLVICSVILFNLPIACTIEDDGSDCEFAIGKFKIGDMAVDVVNRYDYYNQQDTFISSPSIHQDSLAILIRVSSSYPVAQNVERGFNFTFGNKLYACPPSYNVGKSKVSELKIRANDTLKTADTTYLPNSIINDLFWVKYRYEEAVSIQQFEGNQNRLYNTDLNTIGLPNSVIPLIFRDSIETLTKVRFTINLKVDDIREYTLETIEQSVN